MTWSLVSERNSGQIVFGRDSNVPLMLDSLWSPISHNYSLWVWDASGLTYDNLLNHKISWFPKPTIVPSKPENLEELLFNQRKGDLLQHVKRAIEKNRRPFIKSVEGQSEVYRLKTEEASRYLNQEPGDFYILKAEAELDKITMEQAASLIMMKHQQQKQVLLETESRRRSWIRKILEATDSNHLISIQNEIIAYERTS